MGAFITLQRQRKLLLYDDSCLKLDCITLQYVDGQESTSSDSITWLHQNTSDMEDSLVEIGKTSSESKLPYSGKVWRIDFLSIWQINRSANRLLIVSTNLDGFS